MYSRQKQQKDFNKQWRSMSVHLELFMESGNDEALHQLRVDIKKINAILGFFTGRSLKQKRKPLRALFKEAGIIRSADIHLNLLNKYRVPDPALLQEQQVIYSEAARAFRAAKKERSASLKKCRKRLADTFRDVSREKILSAYQDRINEIAEDIRAYDGQEIKLHECRKKMKVLLYVYDVLDKRSRNELSLDLDYLHHIQDTIGQWHDVAVTLDFLREKNIPPSTAGKQLSVEKERLLQSVLKLGRDFDNKVFGKHPAATSPKR